MFELLKCEKNESEMIVFPIFAIIFAVVKIEINNKIKMI